MLASKRPFRTLTYDEGMRKHLNQIRNEMLIWAERFWIAKSVPKGTSKTWSKQHLGDDRRFTIFANTS